LIQNIIENIRYPTAICIVAGVVSTFYFHKLSSTEKWIVLVIFLNILADLLANYLGLKKIFNGDVYNLLGPVEKIITLSVYLVNSKINRTKIYYLSGIIAMILLTTAGYISNSKPGHLHEQVYVISGFIFAILSYLQLRNILLEKAKDSIPIFWFSMANLVYYTLMISVISARPVALSISWDFNTQINIVNDIAYSLWSPIILIGIIWNRTKI